MDALECMKTRRSVRSYLDRAVPKEIVEDIVNYGRLAATANNIQPWQFIAILDPATRKTIAGLTEHGKFIEQSPVCIAVFCEETKYYVEDGSAATQNILNAARAYELGSCWVAGDKKAYTEEIRRLLGLPENYRLVSLIAIGYPAEERNPEKKPISQVLHWDRYSRHD